MTLFNARSEVLRIYWGSIANCQGSRQSVSGGNLSTRKPFRVDETIASYCLLSPAARRIAGERIKVRGKKKSASYCFADP